MSERPETVDSTAEEVPNEDLIREAAEASFDETVGHDVADADEFKPEGRELVVAGDRDVYRVMDRADEIQILDEIQTRPIKEMVYSFQQGGGGGKVTDLSYGGVRRGGAHAQSQQVHGDQGVGRPAADRGRVRGGGQELLPRDRVRGG